jgi:hypothetical protein
MGSRLGASFSGLRSVNTCFMAMWLICGTHLTPLVFIGARLLSTAAAPAAPAAPARVHGGLKDSDRIFTNLHNKQDAFIDGALKRVRLMWISIHSLLLVSAVSSGTHGFLFGL